MEQELFVDGSPDEGVTLCADCGIPCDGNDAVADDSGLAWCGSFYGNGCADSRGDAG